MNKKLWILNLALVAAVATVGVRVRNASQQAKLHEQQTLAKRVAPPGAPPYAPIPTAPAVEAGGYVEIARKLLFDPTRDATIIVDPPPPPPPPPTPEPVPPMPVYQGKANLGDGPIYFMAPAGSKKFARVKVGDEVGPFKLVAASAKELTLEWNGQTFVKAMDELREQKPLQMANAPAGGAPGAPTPPPLPPPPVVMREVGPGEEIAGGGRACAADDSYKEGSVVSGFRKRVLHTPGFGDDCRWVPAQQ